MSKMIHALYHRWEPIVQVSNGIKKNVQTEIQYDRENVNILGTHNASLSNLNIIYIHQLLYLRCSVDSLYMVYSIIQGRCIRGINWYSRKASCGL